MEYVSIGISLESDQLLVVVHRLYTLLRLLQVNRTTLSKDKQYQVWPIHVVREGYSSLPLITCKKLLAG